MRHSLPHSLSGSLANYEKQSSGQLKGAKTGSTETFRTFHFNEDKEKIFYSIYMCYSFFPSCFYYLPESVININVGFLIQQSNVHFLKKILQ